MKYFYIVFGNFYQTGSSQILLKHHNQDDKAQKQNKYDLPQFSLNK